MSEWKSEERAAEKESETKGVRGAYDFEKLESFNSLAVQEIPLRCACIIKANDEQNFSSS